MLKLSRRQWNNVLIFAVLILMFVLYGIPQRATQSDQVLSHRLVAQDAELLMLAFSQTRLVKAGQQWRFQPALNRAVDAEQLDAAWQHGTLTPATMINTDKNRIPRAQVSVQLAGQAAPVIWLLYPGATEQEYLLQQAGRAQWYQLNADEAALLFLLDIR